MKNKFSKKLIALLVCGSLCAVPMINAFAAEETGGGIETSVTSESEQVDSEAEVQEDEQQAPKTEEVKEEQKDTQESEVKDSTEDLDKAAAQDENESASKEDEIQGEVVETAGDNQDDPASNPTSEIANSGTESQIAPIEGQTDEPLATANEVKEDLEQGWSYDPATETLTITNIEALRASANWLKDTEICSAKKIVIRSSIGMALGNGWASKLKCVEELEFEGVTMTSSGTATRAYFYNVTFPTTLKKITFKSCSIAPYVFAENNFAEPVELVFENGQILSNRHKENGLEISIGAFQNVKNIEKVELTNVTSVGENTFAVNHDLKEVTIVGGERIYKQAFYDCNKLEKIHITDAKKIENNAFGSCERLSYLYLDFAGTDGCEGDLEEFAFEDSGTNPTENGEKASLKVEFNDIKDANLAYTNLFERLTAEQKDDFYQRMLKLQAGKFDLKEPTETGEAPELEIDQIWKNEQNADYKVGETAGETKSGEMHLTKEARWTDDNYTEAEVEIQFNYAQDKGKDFLFVIDYSDSIAVNDNMKDSLFWNIQSKTIDVGEELLNTDGYNNRVGIIAFASDDQTKKHLYMTDGFLDKTETAGIQKFIKDNIALPDASSTDYTLALTEAKNMIDARNDISRQVEVIFISDGAPQQVVDGTAVSEELKANPDVAISSIYVVNAASSTLGATDSKTADVMKKIATEDRYYTADDYEEFSKAVNQAIADSYMTYTLADFINLDDFEPVDVTGDEKITVADFDVDCGTVKGYSEKLGRITWEIRGVPYATHTLKFKVRLKDQNGNKDDGYQYSTEKETYLTNGGIGKAHLNAFVERGTPNTPSEKNALYTVSSPELPRILTFNLDITKHLTGYQTSLGDATFAFEVVGTDKDGKQIFSRVAGLDFDKSGNKTVNVAGLPLMGVANVAVREIYSGSNYDPAGAAEQSFTVKQIRDGADFDQRLIDAEFTNVYNSGLNYGSSAINHYSYSENDKSYTVSH